jgi:hypothetical protein
MGADFPIALPATTGKPFRLASLFGRQAFLASMALSALAWRAWGLSSDRANSQAIGQTCSRIDTGYHRRAILSTKSRLIVQNHLVIQS